MGSRRRLFGGFALAWLTGGAVMLALPPAQAQRSNESLAEVNPHAVVQRYCVGCHNEKMRTGGLALDGLDIAHPDANAEVWEKVARRIRNRTMPPVGMPRPDEG